MIAGTHAVVPEQCEDVLLRDVKVDAFHGVHERRLLPAFELHAMDETICRNTPHLRILPHTIVPDCQLLRGSVAARASNSKAKPAGHRCIAGSGSTGGTSCLGGPRTGIALRAEVRFLSCGIDPKAALDRLLYHL